MTSREEERAVLGLLVVLLRSLRHLSQTELARVSGVQKSQISLYELWKIRPTEVTVRRFASVAGVTWAEARKALPVLRALYRLASRPTGRRRGELPGGGRMPAAVGRAAAGAFHRSVQPFLRNRLPALAGRAAAQEARRRAKIPLRDLLRRPSAERWRMVEEYEAYRTWALCEAVALESEKKAADDADVALDLARLAVRMAELTPGSKEWRARIGGRCQAFLANAWRVKGDFPEADEAFCRADRLWQDGAAADPGLILDGARLLDLKASLRRHQGRFEESLDLLEQAVAASRSDQATARLLLKKAFTLKEMGDWQRAMETVERARPLVGNPGDLRTRFGLEFTFCKCLTDAGRHAEAAALLPKVGNLARQLGNGLDLLRCRWLQGLVAAGLGQLEEAVADLEAVAGELAALGIAFDAAQASLDLAVLSLRQGRPAEVKRLAGQIVAVFKAQRVHREALAAVIVFHEAAEQERATAELAKKLSDFLRRAQHAPGLRFEP
jgi:tetratricopeptide (TPR) repeat protein